jgi:hypothetical protein
MLVGCVSRIATTCTDVSDRGVEGAHRDKRQTTSVALTDAANVATIAALYVDTVARGKSAVSAAQPP